METFENLLKETKKYIHDKKSLNLIKKAYDFASEKHKNQKRMSGEPYSIHFCAVARLLAMWRVSPNTVCAGLLHDVVEDQNVSLTTLKKEFNEDIAFLVDKMTKISQTSYKKENIDFLNVRRLIISMASSVRVILIKIADRLHNMRTLQYMPRIKQIRIANETLHVYRHIAYLVGMHDISSELGNLCFKFLQPVEYEMVKKQVEKFIDNKSGILNQCSNEISVLLKNKSIKFEILSRVKSFYSIYKKMNEKKRDFSQIYDVLAMKIITSTSDNCYRIFGLIQNHFTYMISRFKDYISRPKVNMYQSLHTTIIFEKKHFIEIQIRTEEMDHTAAIGIASHWTYKENEGYNVQTEQKQIQNKLWLLKEVIEFDKENAELSKDEDFVRGIQEEVFERQIYTLSPEGDIISMRKGATILDFAFKIHSEVGMHTVSGFVNGRLVPLDYSLENGDVVEVKVNPKINPNREWLSKVNTKLAIKSITKYLRKKEEEHNLELIEKGKNSLKIFLTKNPNFSEIFENKNLFLKKLKELNFKNLNVFYHDIEIGNIRLTNFFSKFFTEEKKKLVFSNKRKQLLKNNVIVAGDEDIKATLAKCCYPIPGDGIVAFISKAHTLKIHRLLCKDVSKQNEMDKKNQIIEAHWNEHILENNAFLSVIKLSTVFSKNSYLEIANAISFSQAAIVEMKTRFVRKTNQNIFTIKTSVKNTEHLNLIFSNLRKISNLILIWRYNN